MNPEYMYIKGQGWVAFPGPIVQMFCKTTVRLEFRQPKPGEKYMCLRKGARSAETLEDYFISRCSDNQYYGLPTKSLNCDDDYNYCTVIPL